jgi:hypothetical protein
MRRGCDTQPAKLVRGSVAFRATLRKPLEGHVQVDPVSEPEAVRDCASDAGDFHALALDAMHIDVKFEKRARDVDHTKGRSLEPVHAGSAASSG